MAHLTDNSYGKSSIRLTKVTRNGSHQDLTELSLDISLHGDFSASYENGDNSQVIATDSMKNTVYVLAKENAFTSIEEFAALLARHFLQTYSQVHAADIAIRQTSWLRIHPHAFAGAGSEKRICRAELTGEKLNLTGGIANLHFIKTTGSEFHGFVTDRYRTLKDSTDRIFATSAEAIWTYTPQAQAADFNPTFLAARTALLDTLANHHSLAVQQTLLAAGDAILKACPALSSIRLTLPNLHRVPVD